MGACVHLLSRPRKLLDNTIRLQVGLHPLDQAISELLMGHFATAIAERDLGLVAFFKKLDEVTQLDLVVAVVSARPELDFLDLDLLLLLLGLMGLLLLAVLELAEIHELADGWLSKGSDLDQIDLLFFRHLEGLTYRHHAELFAVHPYQPHFRYGDLTI